MTDSHRDDIELPVRKQLEAYKARDIDAFMQCWTDDCEYHAFPSQLIASGTRAIRERHLIRFTEPNLFANLVNRLCVGNVVVDQEIVSRTFPEGPGEVDVIAIYEIDRGKIARAWFKMGAPRLHAADTLSLDRARLSDAVLVRALTREAYAKWVPLLGREPTPMIADHEAAVRDHHIDILSLNGQQVALIELIAKPDHLLIENIAVLPTFQGRGLGRKLLAHAERVAIAASHTHIRLYTNKLFADNISLYQKTGYTIDREAPFRDGITVYMSKRV
jgi:ribosomal protein S18 acetylase RimI-like enzyme